MLVVMVVVVGEGEGGVLGVGWGLSKQSIVWRQLEQSWITTTS